jgi:hypothetical protein
VSDEEIRDEPPDDDPDHDGPPPPPAPPLFPEPTEAEVDAEAAEGDETPADVEDLIDAMRWFDEDADESGFDWSAPDEADSRALGLDDLLPDVDPDDPDLEG